MSEPVTVSAQIGERHRGKPGRVPDVVARMAYEVYHHMYPGQTYERLHERGGFGVGELIGFLYARNFPKAEWDARFEEAIRGIVSR